MKILKTAVIALAFTPVLAIAQEYDESWTPGIKREFRQSCAVEMEAAGIQTAKAWEYCDCMSAYTEEEFGLAEFGYLAASEERDMPELERRFEAAIQPCFE